MSNAKKTINSNVTGVSVAEEFCPKELVDPALTGSAATTAANAVEWYDRPVNSYSDFGGELATVAADPISVGRQNQRGTVTDLDASGGYTIDMANHLTRDMQGFFFADAHEKFNTRPLNGTAVAITAVNASGRYSAASGLPTFPVGALVLASGFDTAANNVASRVTASTATALTTDGATVVEASPPATAHVQQVGYAFGSGDLALSVSGGLVTLTSSAGGWANADVQPGEWLFVGGDATNSTYTVGHGYGRVKSKTNNAVVLDQVAWIGAIAANDGSGKAIRVYFGTFVRNEKTEALIKQRTYHVERTLGSDADGVQSEYLTGAVKNELALNLPLSDKHAAEFTYVALDNEQRTGADGIKAGTHLDAPKQKPYNTSSAVFRMSMSLLDPSTLSPTALFAYVSDASFTVNNNASAVKAVGNLGGIDINVGNFVVGGSVTAYFNTVESVKAIRNNKDVGFNAILAQANKGVVYDVPLLGVGGGRLNVEKDNPITVPIENFGAENDLGYTMSYTSFEYLPDIAMPTV